MNLTALISPRALVMEPTAASQLRAKLSRMDWPAHMAQWEAQTRPAVQGLAPEGSGDSTSYDVSGGVATIEIKDFMSKDGAPSLGVTGTSFIRRQVRQAMTDPAVSRVMLLIDSPGGTVSGTADLGADVAKLANVKPTLAYAEDTCCSGAYWVASQANAIYCNSTAVVGSIGVCMSLVDSSGQAEQDGLRYVYVTTGSMKAAGADGVPLTEEQQAYIQGMADMWGKQFFAAVQKGRNFTDEQMVALTDAKVYIGAQARSMGLVDRVTSRDNALAALRAIRLN